MGGKIFKKYFENVSDVFVINGYQLIALNTVLASCNVLHKYSNRIKTFEQFPIPYFINICPLG